VADVALLYRSRHINPTVEWGEFMSRRRIVRLGVAVAMFVAAVATTLALGAGPAGAYGHNGGLNVWQVGLSENCNNPSLCGADLGGFWGWLVFTQDPATGETDADAELTGCSHMVRAGGPGLAGALHFSAEGEWVIAAGSAGDQTFFLTGGTQTITGHGQPVTVPLTNDDGSLTTPDNPLDTGISAAPGHYSTAELLGFTEPGVAFQVQVAYKPAH
jgi:hypothetical protein